MNARIEVAIIGAGSIGVAYALVFARAGHAVRLQDPDAARRDAVAGEVVQRLDLLVHGGLLAQAEVPATAARITVVASVAEAAFGVGLALECVPERLDIKSAVFQALEMHAPATALLCSASSAIPASATCGELESRHRCMVTHPGNPPYLIPVVEIVPAPFTQAQAVLRCRDLLSDVGLRPVVLRREVEGFLFNRLQGALLREAYCLVRDGVAGVEDIDTIVRDGLGLRWSIIGPFETVDLNTRGGIRSHAKKMGPAYARMGAERGQHDAWTEDLVMRVAEERRRLLPMDQWEKRVRWRDERLMWALSCRISQSEPA